MIAFGYNNSQLSGDLFRDGGPIQADRGLASIVATSIFTWKNHPTSWWGMATGDKFGSEMWRLDGRKQSQDTLRDGVDYVRESLQWMIADGILRDVDIRAAWVQTGDNTNVLSFEVDVYRPGDVAPEHVGVWEHQTS